jgi:hypothetical protein
MASETPQITIGLLNPTTDQYQEWRTPFGGQPRSIVLNTLAAASGGGDLWFTYSGAVVRKLPASNAFRSFNLGITGDTHAVAIATNGDAIVSSYNGSLKGIWRIPRGAGAGTVTAQFWATGGSNDFPHDLKVDGAGFVWFSNRSSIMGGPDKVSRLDLSTGNLIEWTLPYGNAVAGLTVANNTTAPFAARSVCVLTGGTGTPGYVDGEALCFDVPASLPGAITLKRVTGGGYNYPQQAAFNTAGDLFLTEQMASAVSYATAAAISSAPTSPIPAITRALGAAASRNITGTDSTITPQATITISGADRLDANVTGTSDGSGRVRFTLPNAAQYSHPVGLSTVVGIPGVTYVAEYFRGYGDMVAGRITRFTLNPPAPPVILLNGTKAPAVPSLSFASTIGGSAPAAQEVAVEEETELPVSWTATSDQPWLTTQAVSNDTVTPSTLRVSVAPPITPGNYTGHITINGADGAASRTIDVTLVVNAQPTIQVTGASLVSEPGYAGKLVFTAVAGFDLLPTPVLPTAQTLMIANTGGGTLQWSTEVTADAGNTVSGGTLTLTPSSGSQQPNVAAQAMLVAITPGNVPGTLGTYKGVLTISSSNASNQQQVRIVLNVVDHGAPTLNLPAPITAEAENGSGAHVSFNITATNTLGNAITPSCTLGAGGPAAVSGAVFALGLTTVNCEANDGLGMKTTGSFAITVVDTAGPVFAGVANKTVEATGPNPNAATVTYALPTATDAVDGSRLVTCSPAPGSGFTLGDTLVSCTASDTTGHQTSATFTVKVQDTTPPVLSGVPGTIGNVEATGTNGAPMAFTPPTAKDLVDGVLPVTCSPAAGSTFPLGTTTVTCSATDRSGKDAKATFTVTVVDTTAPSFANMPANKSVEGNTSGGATVTYVLPTAMDLVGGIRPVSCSPASGSLFPLGPTAVTCSSNDGRGNSANVGFTVTVVDTTAPALTLPDITVQAATPSGANVSFAGATAVDIVGGSRTLTCTPSSGSLFSVGTSTVNCSATDAAGNLATGSFSVTVEGDTLKPVLSLPAADVVAEATSLTPGTTVTYVASASDPDHGALAISCSPASGAAFPIGTTPVACSATDAFGNTTAGSFNVVVRDTTAPVLSLANATANATSASGAPVTLTGSATDLGQSVAVVCNGQTLPASSTFAIGTTTVNCTANDGRGNLATGSLTVTVHPLSQISVAPSQLSFSATRWTTCNGSTQGTTPASQQLTLTNSTNSTMWYLAVGATAGGNWLNLSPYAYYVAPGSSRTITVSVKPEGLDEATYNATITVYTLTSAVGNPFQPDVDKETIPVTFKVNPAPPQLCVTPTSLNFGTLSQNTESAAKFITVSNAGDGTLPAITWTSPTETKGTLDAVSAAGGLRVHVFTTKDKGAQSGSFVIKAGSQTQTITAAWNVSNSKGNGHHHDDNDDDDCHGDHDGDGDHDSNDHIRHRRGHDRD